MTPRTYRNHIHALGFTQESAGAYFGASPRTGQRWAAKGPSLAVSMVLLAVEKNRGKLDSLQKRAIKLRG
jgi:hypothetical protein